MIATLLDKMPNARLLNFLIFVATVLIIGAALYMEHVMLLEPCGLCITQRVFVVLAGLVCLAAAVHNPGSNGRRNYALAAAAMCVAGVLLCHSPDLADLPARRSGPGLRSRIQLCAE